MFPHRLGHDVEFVLGRILHVARRHLVFPVVQPCAHGIAAGKHLRMPLAIDRASASPHGQTHDGPVTFIPDAAVFGLHRRDKFLEEKVFVRPARHVEIAVPLVVHVGMAGIRHKNNHLACLAGTHQFVGDRFHPALLRPVFVGSIQAVQQIDRRVAVRPLGKAVGQIDIVLDRCVQNLAPEAVRYDFSRLHRPYRQQQDQHQHQVLFHIFSKKSSPT